MHLRNLSCMKNTKKAYTLTVIFDSATGDIEFAEERVEKLEKVKDGMFPEDEDIEAILLDSPVFGVS